MKNFGLLRLGTLCSLLVERHLLGHEDLVVFIRLLENIVEIDGGTVLFVDIIVHTNLIEDVSKMGMRMRHQFLNELLPDIEVLVGLVGNQRQSVLVQSCKLCNVIFV